MCSRVCCCCCWKNKEEGIEAGRTHQAKTIWNRMFISLQGHYIISVLIASNFPVRTVYARAVHWHVARLVSIVNVYRCVFVVYRFLLLWKFVCSFIFCHCFISYSLSFALHTAKILMEPIGSSSSSSHIRETEREVPIRHHHVLLCIHGFAS